MAELCALGQIPAMLGVCEFVGHTDMKVVLHLY